MEYSAENYRREEENSCRLYKRVFFASLWHISSALQERCV